MESTFANIFQHIENLECHPHKLHSTLDFEKHIKKLKTRNENSILIYCKTALLKLKGMKW